MKKLHEQADTLVKDLQIIADNLAEYNPGLCKKMVPLEVIQCDISALTRELTGLYVDIGKKIKNEVH